MKYDWTQLKQSILKLGYTWFNGNNYDVNIVGIRNNTVGNKITNKFDDLITVTYRDDSGIIHYKEYKATTDPGIHWANNLLNPDGVAILVPDQYRSSYSIGLHQGKYEALKQVRRVKVYRDFDKDDFYDFDKASIREGIYGINIHRANKWGTSTQIDKWSAGCQVIASNSDFSEFMGIIHKSAEVYGNRFSYTLLESKNII